jgi:hypothetical protein
MVGLSLNNLSTIKKLVANHVSMGFSNIKLAHNDEKLLVAHGVVVWNKQLSPFSQFVSPMLLSPNLSIASPNNE